MSTYEWVKIILGEAELGCTILVLALLWLNIAVTLRSVEWERKEKKC